MLGLNDLFFLYMFYILSLCSLFLTHSRCFCLSVIPNLLSSFYLSLFLLHLSLCIGLILIRSYSVSSPLSLFLSLYLSIYPRNTKVESLCHKFDLLISTGLASKSMRQIRSLFKRFRKSRLEKRIEKKGREPSFESFI
jgi:hypothetical protein